MAIISTADNTLYENNDVSSILEKIEENISKVKKLINKEKLDLVWQRACYENLAVKSLLEKSVEEKIISKDQKLKILSLWSEMNMIEEAKSGRK